MGISAAEAAVGLFGGTFDPVHHGHLRVALEMRERLGLTEVRLLPCASPPHRGSPGASAAQRLAMLERAVAGQPDLIVDRRELDRPGPSYTIDTLQSLREERGDVPLYLLLGSDAFAAFDGWHRWQAIPELVHLVVMRRPGDGGIDSLSAPLRELLAQRRVRTAAELRGAAGGILLQEVTMLAISASAIRALIAGGRSPRYLLPEAVWNYIQQHHLYGFSQR